MIKNVLFMMLMKIANYLTSKEFATLVRERVDFYMDEDIPGSEKKERLMGDLKEMYGEIRLEVAGFTPHLINLVVEIMVANAKARVEK